MGNVIANTVVKVITNKIQKSDEKLYKCKQDVVGVKEENDIFYNKSFSFDFYTPKDKSKLHQVYIVDVHGGAWVYGDKKLNRHFCMHLASYGFPVFNINYGLVPNYTVKQQVQQIIQALHFIHDNAKQYDIENYQLCLAGDSAGAHLVGLISCIALDKQLQKQYEVDCDGIHINCLLLQHGIYDLEPIRNSKMFYMKKLYSWMFPKDELHRINSLSQLITKEWKIPIYLLSSENDKMFCIQTKQFVNKLSTLNVNYKLLLWDKSYNNLRHVFHIALPDIAESQMTYQSMAKFLKGIKKPYVKF